MVEIKSKSWQYCHVHKRVFYSDQCDLCALKSNASDDISRINLLNLQGISQRSIAKSINKSQQYVQKVLARSKDKNVRERFHNVAIKFNARIPYDSLMLPEKFLNHTKYKLFDSTEFYCLIFKDSISIRFHKQFNIYDRKCQVANDLAMNKIEGYLDLIPDSIVVTDDVVSVVSRHNAFMNDQLAKHLGSKGGDLKVILDGKVRAVIDHSRGSHELEYIDKDHVIPDSTVYEKFIGDLIDKPSDLPSVQTLKLNHVVDVLDRYAVQMEQHLAVEQRTLSVMEQIGSFFDSKSKKYPDHKLSRRSFNMTSPRCHR